MDFSLHEQRRLAQMERDLSGDRRLVALMGVLASGRARRVRLLRCFALRLRHPWYGPTVGGRHRFAKLALIAALVLTLAGPPVLITSVVIGLLVLTVVALATIPLSVTLLVLSYRWTQHCV